MLDQPEGTECRQWGQAAWEEAAVRLGYPRLHLEGGDEGAVTGADGLIAKHDRLREAGIISQPEPTNRNIGSEESGHPPQVRADNAPKRPILTTGGGVASIVVAALVGSVASLVVTMLRKRQPC